MKVFCELLQKEQNPKQCWQCSHKGMSALECRLKNMPRYRLVLLYAERTQPLLLCGYYPRRVRILRGVQRFPISESNGIIDQGEADEKNSKAAED